METRRIDYWWAITEAIGGLTDSTAYVPFNKPVSVVNRRVFHRRTVYALKAWKDSRGEHIILCDRKGYGVENLREITEESQKMVFRAVTANY